MGERGLVDYGIQDDKSDYRIHVGFAGGALYFFRAIDGLDALRNGKYEYKTGRVLGASRDTFGGYAVPVKDINGCQEIDIPIDILQQYKPSTSDTTYMKGDKAIAVVKAMLLRGLIPIALHGLEVEEKDLQIRGEDILVSAKFSIQVKCDWIAGRGGFGNLFLQTEERHIRNIQTDKHNMGF